MGRGVDTSILTPGAPSGEQKKALESSLEIIMKVFQYFFFIEFNVEVSRGHQKSNLGTFHFRVSQKSTFLAVQVGKQI